MIVNDMNQHPPQPTLARKIMSEVVGNAFPVNTDLSRNNVVTVGDYDLQLSSESTFIVFSINFVIVASIGVYFGGLYIRLNAHIVSIYWFIYPISVATQTHLL